MSASAITPQHQAAARLIAQADGLLITAGAGLGVDSGLPDFRGDEGLWRAYPALAQGRIGFTSIANPAAFQARPRVAWGFYGHRLQLYRQTVPYEGFHILRRWAQRMPQGAFVFTSNVDGQFQAAGFEQAQVHECHGSIHHLQCATPCSADIWPADSLSVEVDAQACEWTAPLPTCPRCGQLARPNILMFGDGDWLSQRSDAQESRLHAWLRHTARPVVIELGAGLHVPTVRYFSERVARKHGAGFIRINPREAHTDHGLRAISLEATALQGLQAIDAALNAATDTGPSSGP